MQKVFLLCGVPGSGKSWCAFQLRDRYEYIAHDDYENQSELVLATLTMTHLSQKPILVDCPFAERQLRDKLRSQGLEIIPVFIIEHPHVIRRRYEERDGKPIPKQHLTRALSIQDRAEEWNAFWGTAAEVLTYLKEKARD